MRTKGVGFLLLVWGTAAALAGAQGAPSRSRTLRDPELHLLYHHDNSRPLREMPVIPPIAEEGEERLHPVKLIRPPRVVPRNWVDPLAQAAVSTSDLAPLVSTTPGLSFDGVGAGFAGFTVTGAPPDTNGAVGATQYVQWVNTSFAVFNKSTGALLYGPAAGNTLWQGFGGPCETTNSGDPVAMYDKAANRWVMTQFSINQGASQFFQCVAVSTTSDATGSYRRFAFQFNGFNDYPKGGVWPDGYYLTFNMFNAAGTAFLGARVCALDRNQMITAAGTPGPIQCFQLSTTFGGLLPADLDGATPPPSGAPNYMVAFDDTNNDGLNLWKFHVDWADAANSTLTGPTKITTAAFAPACGGGTCIPQPGTTQRLDSLADRLMFRLAYRNFGSYESLVVNHSVTVGTTASGVRWYELRSPGATPTLFQSGTFSPDATSRWMGSIAQDQQGNMLLGYSASSSALRPGIYYTGRLVSDAPGTMQAESTLMTGIGSQTGGLSRWGDYSAMTIDPVDDCTFWFTSEYLKTTGSFNWSTRIGSFKFPGCGGAPVPDFAVSASPSSLTVAQGGNGASTVTISSLSGFSAQVDLSCTGLPSGATCAFNPASVTPPAGGSAGSTLTLSISSSTAAGSYSFQVTGSSGALSHAAPVSLAVTPVGGGGPQTAAFDATLKAPACAVVGSSCDSGPSLLLGRDGKGPEPNQPNTIASSCADGTVGTFHSDESNDRLKVSTLDGTDFTAGKTVRIDATGWAWTTPSADHLDLYYAANAASPAWTFIGTLTPTVAGSQVLSATYTLPAGTMEAVRAQFRYQGTASPCTSGSYNDHDDLAFVVGSGSPPDFTLSASPSSLTIAQGASGTGTAMVTSLNGFSAAVSLSCTGLPSGATCAFNPASVTPVSGGSASSSLTVSVGSSTAAGAYSFSIVGTSGSTTHSTALSLTVTPPPPPPPDFSLQASPSSLTIAQGANGTSTATVASLNGFSSAVSLSCTGLPAGATCAFVPTSVTPPASGTATSGLTVSVDAGVATGSYSVSVVGTSGPSTRSTPLALTVTPAGSGPQTATFDPTLKAPKCAVVGSSCDSGPSLLLGRNTKGPEPNQPNTINSSCTDGNVGTFHSDESNDRIKVSTTDATSFAAGKTVRIDATVWAWTTPSADHLDLYYTANAASPTWTFLTTLTPAVAGAQTLSATYSLPAGSLQAVRAQFRYAGSATACTLGSYNDHDDLAFAVP